MNKKAIIIIIFLASVIGNGLLGFLLMQTTYQLKHSNKTQQVNAGVVSFTNLFIEKVLMANQDVDFDTRLTLETMVRNLNDKDILSQWEKFTRAGDNQTASIEAKKLLNVLVKKISY